MKTSIATTCSQLPQSTNITRYYYYALNNSGLEHLNGYSLTPYDGGIEHKRPSKYFSLLDTGATSISTTVLIATKAGDQP